MVSLRSGVTASLTFLSLLRWSQAVPLADKLRLLSPSARDLLKRATPAAPHFVAYSDKWVSPFPSTSDLQGYNVFALSFLTSAGAVDQAQNWQGLTASDRTTYMQQYNGAGISVIVSAFGSTEKPTTSGEDPVGTANTMAAWVTQYGVNGIDVDYEDLAAFDNGGGSAESWLTSFTQQLRTKLPQGQYILTHAPLAPWFSPTMWSGGGYLAVAKSVGSMIDWYNLQFYNQGDSEYTTCSGLLTTSSSAFPETAIFQIAANGVNLDKLVIGKPGTTADAASGYMDPSTLASCVSQAASQSWNAGVMVWEYPDAGSSWITTVRGNTWPVSGPLSPITTISTASSTNSTSTASPTTTIIPTVSPTNTTSTASPTTIVPTVSPTNITSTASPTIIVPTVSPPNTTSTASPTTTISTASPTSTGTSGSSNCAGVSAWSNTVVYPSGSQATYNGYLWTANQLNVDETPGGTQDLSGAWTNGGACT